MPISLAEVLAATGGRVVGRPPDDLQFEVAFTDSRKVRPGGLFIALLGAERDGHDFIAQAVAAGARAVLCRALPGDEALAKDRAVQFVVVPDTRAALVALAQSRLRALPRPVVAITGSAGKTTTKEMAADVLARRYRVLRSPGNLNTYTGIPLTLLELAAEHQVVVMEYAMSRAGEIRELTAIAPPEVAVVLNVGLAHVGLLGSIDAVARAKRELVEGIRADGTALLNGDDPRVRDMASATPAQVRNFGFAPDAWVRAERVRLHGLHGSVFELVTERGRQRVYLRVPGLQAVQDALAAAAVGEHFGVPLTDIAGALHAFKPPARRMSQREGAAGSLILDDCYNSSPSSLRAALGVLRLAGRRSRRIAVLGDMLELGDHSTAAHAEAGRAAAESAQYLVVLGEHAPAVMEGARSAGLAPERIRLVSDPQAAVEAVQHWVRPGAVILVKGSRGVELERVVAELESLPGAAAS